MRLYLFGFLLLFLLADVEAVHKKVALSQVKTLTLKQGQMTTGRRNAPIPQLTCVGGGAQGKYQPKVVQCTQTGHDGIDYQWRCAAEMPQEYEFGAVTVACEGYDYPEDPNILHGSCGLEYDLEYAADNVQGKAYNTKKQAGQTSFLENLVPILTVCFIVFIVVYTLFGGGNGNIPRDGPRRFGGGGFDHGPGYPPSYPSDAPPPYDDSFSHKPTTSSSTSNSTGSNLGGFWTGAGVGALGGYLFGRNQASGSGTTTRQRTNAQTAQQDTSFTSFSAPSSTPHTSTGYGGTSRR